MFQLLIRSRARNVRVTYVRSYAGILFNRKKERKKEKNVKCAYQQVEQLFCPSKAIPLSLFHQRVQVNLRLEQERFIRPAADTNA
jgi:hypothetical protein